MNIGTVTRSAAHLEPGRTALVIGEHAVSYGELEASVQQAVAALAELGVAPGTRIGLLDDASQLAVATLLGAARLGAAACLLNVHLTPGEITRLLAAVDCGLVLVAGERHRATAAHVLDAGAVRHVLDGAMLSPATPSTRPPTATPDDGLGEAIVLFTSGTTGLPKPVPIRHDVVAQRLQHYAVPFTGQSDQGVDMMSAPLFHIGGSLGLFITLYAGRKMVMLPRFDAGEWLRQVALHRVEQTFLVPTMMERILRHPDFDRTDLGSLRTLHYGAAAARVELVEEALERFPETVDFHNAFGQTETLGAYAALTPDDHRARRHLGSAGRPFPGVEVRIVEPGTERDVPSGEVGEILLQAGQTVNAGWLRTGDLASMNAEGYLFPAGRLSDTINRGGEKFGPIEVEAVLRAHPRIVDAAVAGLPDPELGERVGAAVVTSAALDPQDILDHCRAHLARFKVPERIAITQEIPRTALGKVSRQQLAAFILEHDPG